MLQVGDRVHYATAPNDTRRTGRVAKVCTTGHLGAINQAVTPQAPLYMVTDETTGDRVCVLPEGVAACP